MIRSNPIDIDLIQQQRFQSWIDDPSSDSSYDGSDESESIGSPPDRAPIRVTRVSNAVFYGNDNPPAQTNRVYMPSQ